MLRDVFSSRGILAGLVFVIVAVTGTQLYSWHVRRTTEAESERHDRFLQRLKQKNEAHPAEALNVLTDTETPGFVDTPDENTDTQMSDETEAGRNGNENIDIAETFLGDDIVSEEEHTEGGPVSPNGFGPYPEIPADYPEYLMPFWVKNPNFEGVPGHAAEPFELMDRVLIELWKQGHTNLTGASLSKDDGKIYPHYANTAYVRYKEFTTPDGGVHREVSRIQGGPDIAPFFRQIQQGNTPAHIQLLDYDSAGIDPHTFLKKEN